MYKLLIVDDEKMIREGIQKGVEWEKLGIMKVYTAATAREAIEIIDRERPQIMLTDISMAEMSGLDLIDHVRNEIKEQEMRIIVLTGYDRFDYARQCLEMRVQQFLLKPVDEEELQKNVKKQLEALEEIRMKKEQDYKNMRTEGSRKQNILEKFLRELVHQKTTYQDKEEYAKELKQEKDRTMQVAILIPDVHTDVCQEERDFRKIEIKNICMDLIDSRSAGLTFTDTDGKIVVVFYTSGLDWDVSERAKELHEILEDEYGIKPRMVLGSEVQGLDALYISYHDAVYLLEQERVGFQEIVKSSREQNREKIIQDIYNEFKNAMLSNLADGEYVLHIFDKLCQATISYNISRMQVQRWCLEIASDVYFACLTDACMKDGETDEDGRIEKLMRVLSSAGKEEALEVTGMFLGKLLLQEKQSQHEIIVRARRYIEEHLEETLSVANLSERFYVSPNYFSRLFKKVMGEGCNEYIAKRRIEQSCFLLETTTMKTGKIASMVGYNDTNYFSLAFKKHTGMSPTAYRDMKQHRKES